jgi:hypothetical protein
VIFSITGPDGTDAGQIEAESEDAARAELRHERIFGDAPVTLTPVKS